MPTPVMWDGYKPAGLMHGVVTHPLMPGLFASALSTFTPIPIAAALKGGTTGASYSETISVQGGTSPYTFAVASGSLPAGTSLNTSTGVISGTPTGAATYTFAISATDAHSLIGTTSFSITIAAPSVSGAPNSGFVA